MNDKFLVGDEDEEEEDEEEEVSDEEKKRRRRKKRKEAQLDEEDYELIVRPCSLLLISAVQFAWLSMSNVNEGREQMFWHDRACGRRVKQSSESGSESWRTPAKERQLSG